MYAAHFGEDQTHYRLADIRAVGKTVGDENAVEQAAAPKAAPVPKNLSLPWASFPCTDLSLAGGREGLAGKHSSTFWDSTRVLENLDSEKHPVAAPENINGFATSEDIGAPPAYRMGARQSLYQQRYVLL